MLEHIEKTYFNFYGISEEEKFKSLLADSLKKSPVFNIEDNPSGDIEDSNIDRNNEFFKPFISVNIPWSHIPLATYQLIALSLGKETLAIFSLALMMDFRQLRAGGPDLFLLRFKFLNENNKEKINLEKLIGTNWNGFSSSLSKYNDENSDDYLGEADPFNKESKEDQDKDSNENPKKKNNFYPGRMASIVNKIDKFNKRKFYFYSLSNLILSYSKINNINLLTLECKALSVEVKGPSDRLSERQKLWLRLLNLSSNLFSNYREIVNNTFSIEDYNELKNNNEINNNENDIISSDNNNNDNDNNMEINNEINQEQNTINSTINLKLNNGINSYVCFVSESN